MSSADGLLIYEILDAKSYSRGLFSLISNCTSNLFNAVKSQLALLSMRSIPDETSPKD